MTLPAVAHREAELLKIYGVEIWEIARILNM